MLLNLVFLYSRIPPYLPVQLRALLDTGRIATIDVVHWDAGDSRGNLYVPEQIKGVTYHPRSVLNLGGLLNLLNSKNPQIVYVSGWMDRGYISALRAFRKNYPIKVVAGVDDQWHGSLRQWVGAMVARALLRNVIDVMWVAGGPQRIYAERFGYQSKRIIPHLLSADTKHFSSIKLGAKKRFLFLGRFDSVKGLDVLVSAYNALPKKTKDTWTLELIGDGPLREGLEKNFSGENIVFQPYIQPSSLPALLHGGGIACFPSHHEQWGVAIHELAASGFPLLLSNTCGAATEFLIHGYNGYQFPVGDILLLTRRMQEIADLDEDVRLTWGERSRSMAARITPELSAASLLSLADPQ